jgi:hypothetical protein
MYFTKEKLTKKMVPEKRATTKFTHEAYGKLCPQVFNTSTVNRQKANR